MPHDPFIGQTIDEKIRIESLIGSGGMGIVYKAWHSGLDKWVAVKVLSGAGSADPQALARFRREAEALSKLNHVNILRIYSFGILREAWTQAAPYLVLEFLPDGSVEDKLKIRGSLPLLEAMHILRDAGTGLSAAHDVGVAHRDLKPSNIMFAGENAPERALEGRRCTLYGVD